MSTLTASSAISQAGIEHISPSGISRFVRCPESWRQYYLQKKPESVGWKALLGSADSSAYETYYGQRIAGVRMPLSDVKEAFAEGIRTEMEEREFDMDEKGVSQTAGDVIDYGMPTIDAYYPVAERMPDPVAVEKNIRIEHPSLPVPITGRLDVKFKHLVVERKSTGRAGLQPAWGMQADIYSAAESLPLAFHVTTRTKVPKVWTPEEDPRYEIPWSEAKAAKTIKRVGMVLAQMEACLLMFGTDDSWPTHGTAHEWACSKCSFKSSCLAWS